VKTILDTYSSHTRKLINPEKCSIIFGNSCPCLGREVKVTQHVTQEAFETNYLVLPAPERRMSSGKFQSLQAKLAKCLAAGMG
jgi:hypothetical protein